MSLHLVLAISHVDLRQAMRWMNWVGFLAQQQGNSMLEEKILLVASQRAASHKRYPELCWLASRIFKEARSFVPEPHETGWPGAANWMFRQGLEHVERHWGEDVFFCEPDGVPIRPSWFDELQDEWAIAKERGKSFMGALVPHNVNHMTGIACYGRDWRQKAPIIVQCPDHDAWDVYGASQVIPNMLQTNLIQHIFRRHEPGWGVPNTAILDGRACVFHQDKQGRLIVFLDTERYAGGCIDHPLFGYRDLLGQEKAMRKFYYATTATLPKKAGGFAFIFEQLETFGGNIPGAYTTDLETEQSALFELTSNPTSGVTEVSQEDYEKLTKKKLPQPITDTSSPSSKPPKAVMFPAPSGSPALLVAEPTNQPSEPDGPPVIKDIDDVLKVDTVVPADIPKSNRPRKLPNVFH